jgi:uncharacterized membrane protein
MNEFLNSYKALKGTLLRTVFYTLGHFIIAAGCVMYFTGADFIIAMTDAIVEPILNAVWYFVLDWLWIKNKNKKQLT